MFRTENTEKNPNTLWNAFEILRDSIVKYDNMTERNETLKRELQAKDKALTLANANLADHMREHKNDEKTKYIMYWRGRMEAMELDSSLVGHRSVNADGPLSSRMFVNESALAGLLLRHHVSFTDLFPNPGQTLERTVLVRMEDAVDILRAMHTSNYADSRAASARALGYQFKNNLRNGTDSMPNVEQLIAKYAPIPRHTEQSELPILPSDINALKSLRFNYITIDRIINDVEAFLTSNSARTHDLPRLELRDGSDKPLQDAKGLEQFSSSFDLFEGPDSVLLGLDHNLKILNAHRGGNDRGWLSGHLLRDLKNLRMGLKSISPFFSILPKSPC